MIAKLRACEHALAGGVDDVVIVDGRDAAALVAASEQRRRALTQRLRMPSRPERLSEDQRSTGVRATTAVRESRRMTMVSATTSSRASRGTCCRPTGASR